MTTSTPLDIINDLETYLGAHAIDSMVKDMMVACFKERPDQPEGWMLRYMMKRSAGAANEQVAVAGTEDASTHLAVANSDHATQQYLSDKKVHTVLLELLKQVVQEKPENVLSFVATVAHKLHKESQQPAGQ